ncbi:Pre-mRNA-splicing factor 18 [Hondaea fermentalgiana]|uniref:Pre-mRNA-splicing factor 18 n=1 Tax=Hondaea fermentalgiana TaxID=2315210 RepID=A0A2R5GNX3_9STRA|nr:Pre-mRNA-splicing factor 18 [Hondaea fermentalgiana]|eukprot:GBG32596.1 Pre-mRNA-splicing factor 18 [Hondaea fermentalgiana]
MDALAALIADGRAARAARGPQRGGRVRVRPDAASAGEDAAPEKKKKKKKTHDGEAAAAGAQGQPNGAREREVDGEASASTLTSSKASPRAAADGADAKMQELTREEVVRRLRARGEPATLFGEQDATRLARLRALEKQNMGADEHKGMKLKGSHAPSLASAAATAALLAAEDEARTLEGISGETAAAAAATAAGAGIGAGAALSSLSSSSSSAAGAGAGKGDFSSAIERTSSGKKRRSERSVTDADVVNKKTAEKRVLAFMKLNLDDWQAQVNSMDAAQRRSVTGRKEAQTLKQTQDHLRPLKKLLKNKQVAPEVLEAVDRMVQLCMKKEYTQAADQYVRLAIGNDPWPIGVTMVGIHERKGRERINAGKVAHVMNDEAQRKYLTSLKRLLTFRQNTHPADPSKMLQ